MALLELADIHTYYGEAHILPTEGLAPLVVMDQGRIQFAGTPDALREDPTIQQRFLEV